MRMRFIVSTMAGLIVTLSLVGCGTRQFSSTGRELMRPMQTAISAKNVEWLDATAKKIVAQHEAKAVSDSEFAALNKIMQQARSGDWKSAQRALFVLVDGQRATAADISQLKESRPKQVVEDQSKASFNGRS